MTEAMKDWLRRTIEVLVWIIAVAMILDIWGIQIGPIVAGLGLFGVALALGAQDVFKNIFAGIFILSENRFQKGDRIRIGNTLHGIVDHIGFRSTTVKLFDSSPVFVPNADLSDAQVVNHQMMEVRRLDWTINLTYNTKIEQLTGFKPQTDIRVGLQKTIDWIMKPRNLQNYKTEIYNV